MVCEDARPKYGLPASTFNLSETLYYNSACNLGRDLGAQPKEARASRGFQNKQNVKSYVILLTMKEIFKVVQ